MEKQQPEAWTPGKSLDGLPDIKISPESTGSQTLTSWLNSHKPVPKLIQGEYMPTQFNDLLSSLGELNRADKLRAMYFLISELAKEENLQLDPHQTYPVWSPYDSFDAAQTLLKALQTDIR